jgi:hypothetical protein
MCSRTGRSQIAGTDEDSVEGLPAAVYLPPLAPVLDRMPEAGETAALVRSLDLAGDL